MHTGTATAPERMGQGAELMQQRSAAMATMTNAFNALYAVLTPEQKAFLDQHPRTVGPPRNAFRAARQLTHSGRAIRPDLLRWRVVVSGP